MFDHIIKHRANLLNTYKSLGKEPKVVKNKVELVQKSEAIEKEETKDTKGKEKPLTPFEHQALMKSRITGTITGQSLSTEELEKGATEYFEKGRKANVGEVRKYGGQDYIKTANGWKRVGKNKGKYKEAHDTVHGAKNEGYTDSELQKKHYPGKDHNSTEGLAVQAQHQWDEKKEKWFPVKPLKNEKGESEEDNEPFGPEEEKIVEEFYNKTPEERIADAKILAEKTNDSEKATRLGSAFEDENFHTLAATFFSRAEELKKNSSSVKQDKDDVFSLIGQEVESTISLDENGEGVKIKVTQDTIDSIGEYLSERDIACTKENFLICMANLEMDAKEEKKAIAGESFEPSFNDAENDILYDMGYDEEDDD